MVPHHCAIELLEFLLKLPSHQVQLLRYLIPQDAFYQLQDIENALKGGGQTGGAGSGVQETGGSGQENSCQVALQLRYKSTGIFMSHRFPLPYSLTGTLTHLPPGGPENTETVHISPLGLAFWLFLSQAPSPFISINTH